MVFEIREGFGVYLHDGEVAAGAVRRVNALSGSLVIYVENAGEFEVPHRAIRHVTEDKVVLDPAKLDPVLAGALGHAHDAEDPLIADRPLPEEEEGE